MMFVHSSVKLVFLTIIFWFNVSNAVLVESVLRNGIKINMSEDNSAISVGAANPCLHYVDKSASNRCEAFRGCIQRGVADIEKKLKDKKNEQPERLAQLYSRMAALYATDEALLHKSAMAYERATRYAKKVSEDDYLDALGRLGVVQMRLGELKNCSENHNSESCIFPLSENARHRDKKGSLAARKSFEEYLKKRPYSYHIKWLLNVVNMTLGSFPDGVEKKHRLPMKKNSSLKNIPRFKDISTDLGIVFQEESGGALVDDFDNDGLLDIMLSSRGYCDSGRYFRNTGKGFQELSKESGLSQQLNYGQMFQADYDNDGFLDVYITRGAWEVSSGFSKWPVSNKLLRNVNGKFIDVTEKVGLSGNNANVASVWADFDNNGWVDLFVCNENRKPDLFLNKKGKFRNVISQSGIAVDSWCKGAAAGDIDNNGTQDLFVSDYGGENRLFKNIGKAKFVRSRQKILEEKPLLAFPAWMWDFDNDGWLDIFVGAFPRDTEQFARSLWGKATYADSSRLFRNMGNGKFEDYTERTGLSRVHMTMGANFGDINNDGYLDFLLGTGSGSFGDLEPNAMYINNQGKSFTDVTIETGLGSLQKGHGVSFADLDNNGSQDVVVQLGGTAPADRYFPSVMKNSGNDNDWIVLRLKGEKSNSSAIGARVHVKLREKSGSIRSIHRVVSSGSSFGANSLQLEIGLGRDASVESITVDWPVSGKKVYKKLKPKYFYKVEETATSLERIPVSPVDFVIHKKHDGMHH